MWIEWPCHIIAIWPFLHHVAVTPPGVCPAARTFFFLSQFISITMRLHVSVPRTLSLTTACFLYSSFLEHFTTN